MVYTSQSISVDWDITPDSVIAWWYLTDTIHASELSVYIFGLVINATGAIGDVYIVAWLLSQSSDTLISDKGDLIIVYQKQHN